MEPNRLIAYNILKTNIIDNGFCTACGACEAACPTSVLKLENEQVKRLYDCSEFLEVCPICYEVCPHSEAFLLRSLEPLSDAPIRSEAIGYFRKILLAQTNDPKITDKNHDGAVVTTLLTYGINNKLFDSAIVTQTEISDPIKPRPLVALAQNEVLDSKGSKFFPSPVIQTYEDAVNDYNKEKIALVGLPCQILALRKIDAWKYKISGKAKLIIGLFCFGTFSSKPFVEYIEKTYNIPPSDIKRIQLSKELMVETNKGTIAIPMTEAKSHILPSCRTCIDFTAEVADISVGRAYPLTDWSVVIIRTKRGEDIFNQAVEKGLIKTLDIQQKPQVFERIIIVSLQKRTSGFVEASKLENNHGYVPLRLLRETESLATMKVGDIMTKETATVPSRMTVSELLKVMAVKKHIGYPVINENGEPTGIVTIEEASSVDKENRDKTTVGEIARKNIDVCYPNETGLDAFRKMSKHETGRIVVIDPGDRKKILGIITKRDLMHVLVSQACESGANNLS